MRCPRCFAKPDVNDGGAAGRHHPARAGRRECHGGDRLFINSIASSNKGFFIIRLKPFEERHDPALSAGALIQKLYGEFAAVGTGLALPLNLPPIIGLGSTGGFQYVLEALQGQPFGDVSAVLGNLIVQSNGQPELAGVFSTFAANTPQLYLDIDRDKAQALGVNINDIFNALQTTLGGYYVNNFNLFGRTWQVNVQAETPYRKKVDDVYQVYVKNSKNEMVPMRALADVRLVLGPQMVTRYNNYRAVIVNGPAAPGYSTGDALAAMEKLSATALPAGYAQVDRDRLPGEARRREDHGRARHGGAVRLPVPGGALRAGTCRSRPALGRRGRARRRRWHQGCRPRVRRLRPDRARRPDRSRGQERDPDQRVRTGAALQGRMPLLIRRSRARLRFRPVMMTSFAFILGLLPLVIATGAGAAISRRAVGTPVFAGMLAASTAGVLVICSTSCSSGCGRRPGGSSRSPSRPAAPCRRPRPPNDLDQ